MTVPAQTTLFNESTANGLTTSFPYEFMIASADDITVELDGVETTTGFTVTGVGDEDGGAVVFSVAPDNGVKVLRYLDPVLNRETDYQALGDFPAGVVNFDFNRIWLAMQSLKAKIARAVKLPVATSDDQIINMDADDRANRVFGFNEYGDLTLFGPSDTSLLSVELSKSAGASLVGYLPGGDGAVATTVQDKLRLRIDALGFMTGAQRADVLNRTGAIDVTAAVRAALTHANGFLRNGIVATMKHPGAALKLPGGRYNLASLDAPLDVLCDLFDEGAEFVVPDAYAGEVLRVGHTTSGTGLYGAEIHLPDVVKSTSAAIVAGSVGIRVVNLSESRLRCKRTFYFETGIRLGGLGDGTADNDIWLPHALYCKRAFYIRPETAGWCNANRFFGGHVQQSTSFAGGVRASGWRHLLVDGSSPATAVVGNTFVAPILEGNASEYLVEMKGAYGNTFVGAYHESGAPSNAVTVSGDTLTKTAHGLAVGDMVMCQATVAPTGMFLAVPYYVVSVPTADTFKISLAKGGTAVTFGSSGTSVTYTLCTRMLFDGTSTLTSNNRFINTFTTSSVSIDYIESGQALGNGNDSAYGLTRRNFAPEDIPVFRGANTSVAAGLSRPIFAAYSPTVNPTTDPKNWSSAISDRGLAFAASSAEIGLLSNSGGVMQYKRPADAVAYEVASCRRAQSLIAITALSCAANSMTYTDLALTGAAANDHAVVCPAADLPAGLILSHARCSATDTVRVGFFNTTGSPISLTVNVNVMAVRRFF